MTETSSKLPAGAPFPDISVPQVGGGQLAPASMDGWRLLVVYRGKHCPLCKRYLDTLNDLRGDFDDAGVKVMAVSADPLDKAQAQVSAQDLKFPVGHDLSVAQMQQLGLYVSEPRSAKETDRPFAEPGLFLVNPKGGMQIIDVSNAPFARPDLASLLKGIKHIIEDDYPVRGTMA